MAREVIAKMKSFEQWHSEEVENSFGLVKVPNHATLLNWLAVETETISDNETNLLLEHQRRLQNHVDYWGEEDLKMFFISPLLLLANYDHPQYQPFTERKLSAKIGDIEVGGVVDFLIAKGKATPKRPYFCLHEYKWVRRSSNDPIGQLLIAMVCAQSKNNNPQQPIYGVIVEGRLWYFMILLDKEYGMVEPYTATREDIFIIFKALKKVKVLIEPYL